MKTILYMAITADGFIAKENDDTSFVSDTEWQSFQSMVQRTRNLVVGKRTYEVMKREDGFSGLEDARVVVVSADNHPELFGKNHSVVGSPQEALVLLEKEGFFEVLVAGGGMLNGSFMEQSLIDEIYLDVEPLILGKGIGLFGGKKLVSRLELLDTRKLSEDEVQLHYRVIK